MVQLGCTLRPLTTYLGGVVGGGFATFFGSVVGVCTATLPGYRKTLRAARAALCGYMDDASEGRLADYRVEVVAVTRADFFAAQWRRYVLFKVGQKQ
jgi:hypothetical protein